MNKVMIIFYLHEEHLVGLKMVTGLREVFCWQGARRVRSFPEGQAPISHGSAVTS